MQDLRFPGFRSSDGNSINVSGKCMQAQQPILDVWEGVVGKEYPIMDCGALNFCPLFTLAS